MIDGRRDLLIRSALTPGRDVVAPVDLASAIGAEIRATPQARASVLGRIATLGRDPRVRLVLVFASLLLALLAALGVASRLQTRPPAITAYHGPPSRTGVMPGPAPHGTPTPAWQAQLTGQVGVLGMPLVVDGTVLVADGAGLVTAVTEAAGTPVWAAPVDDPGAISLAVVGDLVVAGGENGRLHAVRRATGETAWSVDIGAGGSLNVVADGGILVVASTDAHVYGVDPQGGAVLWDLRAAGQVTRGAAVAAGVGIVGDDAGRVTEFEVATGRVIHAWELGPGEITTPVMDAGVAFVAHGFADGSPAILVALPLAGGPEQWRWTLPHAGRLFIGAVAEEQVYALDDEGTAWMINGRTGTGAALYQAKGAFGSVGAIVGQELILTSADGAIAAIDRATGAVHWTVSVEGVPSTPSVIDGRVFVATNLGTLIALGDEASASP